MDQSQSLVDKYLASLSEKQMKAYLIAKSHLGMSFSIEKSTGYLEWVRDQGTKSGNQGSPTPSLTQGTEVS